MTAQLKHLSDDDLMVLLDEGNGSESCSSEHLDQCEACQNRMTRLAAVPERWSEMCDMLKPNRDDDADFGILTRHRFGDLASSRNPDQSSVKELLSPPSHPELLGRLDRYEIERVIGSGGMGIVLKGHDSELNRPVAVKLLATHLAHSGTAKQRFAREARAAAAVVHEHVVSIFNVASDARVPYLVMQYVDGESLQELVDRSGPLATEQILRIGKQVASGLAAAHEQGVIHRDIKPANILVEGGVERALLSDFGLARIVDDASLTQTGVITGTPHYMSPEQAAGEIANEESDLFSLGAVLYFMATGHPPFRAERPMAVLDRIRNEKHRPAWQLNEVIPDSLSDLIDELLDKRPRKRVSTAAALHQRLSELLTSRTKRRRRRSLFRRVPKLPRVVVVIVALLGVIAAVLSMTRLDAQSHSESPSQETFEAGNARFLLEDEIAKQDTWTFGSLPSGTTHQVVLNEHFAKVVVGLSRDSRVQIVVLNNDRQVELHKLVDKLLHRGRHEFTWEYGDAMPGFHTLTIEVDGQKLTQQIDVPIPSSNKIDDSGDGG